MSVTQNNAVPLQNSVAATGTLIPLVTTDQNLLNFTGYNTSSGTDEGTCNTVVPITFSSISLINNSLPLAYHITDKLRNSIVSEILQPCYQIVIKMKKCTPLVRVLN